MHFSKVQQVGENLFRVVLTSPKKELLIEPGRRMHLTDYIIEVPEKASQIAMFLRKKLENKKVIDIQQHENDRIIIIIFTDYKLIIEFFSNGNFVLTDSDYKILFTFRKEEWKDRKLERGEVYKFPTNLKYEMKEDYAPVTKKEFEEKGMMKALDDYYSAIKKENKKLKKLIDRLEHQKKALDEFQNKSNEAKKKADLIYGNYQEVEQMLNDFNKHKEEGQRLIKTNGKKVVLDLN